MSRQRTFVFCVLFLLTVLLSGPAIAQYSFTWEFADQGAVKDFFELQDFVGQFTNTSAQTDSFRVTIVKDMPPTWQATICEGPVCYPPFITEHTFVLDSGESTNLDFALTAVTDPGQGTTIATVESLSDPGVNETNYFRLISTGVDVLYVAADGAAANESYYLAAITAAGRTTGVWFQDTMGKVAAAELAAFEAVVWNTGLAAGGLDAPDRADLQAYVAAGGNLYLNGPDLAYDYCSPLSGLYSPAALAWFQQVMGVDFITDNSLSSVANGLAGDPVAAGLSLSLTGGDGAPVNATPDVLAVAGASQVSMNYGSGQSAAIISVYGEGRTYFTGFGFEGLSSASDRTQFMTLILDWITSRVVAVGDDLPALMASTPVVRPNPFNPQTSIQFEIGGDRTVPVALMVYDIQGRLVRNLFAGPLAPGPRSIIWNGRNDAGHQVASGIFMARISVGTEVQTVKMTLTK